jgi:uncharacterized spore protein YtfJ
MKNSVEKIAKSVTSVGAKRSYGDPVKVGGVKMVPVALVNFGFGGGSDETGKAAGGGGGGMSIPVGAYVSGPRGGVHFRPNPVALIGVLVPVFLASSLALSAVAKVIRARA